MGDRETGRRKGEGASGGDLDRLAVPLVLIDEAGRVRQANRAGRCLAGEIDGVEAAPGSALCSQPFEQRLLMAATAVASRPAARRLGRITVRRGEERPVDLLVARLAASERQAGAFAVLLVDPAGEATPAHALARDHGLNHREREHVARILGGTAADGSAPGLGGGRESARSPLGGVFGKLGTTRQVDLVRLLLAGIVELRG